MKDEDALTLENILQNAKALAPVEKLTWLLPLRTGSGPWLCLFRAVVVLDWSNF